MKSTHKKFILNITLILFSIIVFFTLFEITLKVTESHASKPQPDKFITWDAEKNIMINIPNKKGIHKDIWGKKEYNISIKINSHGFREYDYPYNKKNGTFRIIVLGDSFTEGLQVPLNETFVKILEKKLNSNYKGKRFEVLNLGVEATDTVNEYLILKYYGKKYNPDLVMLAFFTGNDVSGNMERAKLRNDGSIEILENFSPKIYPENKSILSSGFFMYFKSIFPLTYKFLQERRSNYIVLKNAQRRYLYDLHVYEENYSPEWRDSWKITEKMILKIKNESNSIDAKLMVVCLSHPIQIDSAKLNEELSKYPELKSMKWDLEKPDRLLEEIANKNNITYLGLCPFFQDYHKETGKELHYRYDGHWNSEGHKLATELIYQKIVDDSLI